MLNCRHLQSCENTPEAISSLKNLQDGASPRKRWPLWLALERMRVHLTWRTAQAAYLAGATADCPQLEDAAALPASYHDLFRASVQASMHHHKPARDAMVKLVNECCAR